MTIWSGSLDMVMIFVSYGYVRVSLWKVVGVENSVFSWFRKGAHMCKSREENSTANEQNVSVSVFIVGSWGFFVLLHGFDVWSCSKLNFCFCFLALFCFYKALVEALYPRRIFNSSLFRSTVWSNGLFSELPRLKTGTVWEHPQTSYCKYVNKVQIF